jgi:hypothetical protein
MRDGRLIEKGLAGPLDRQRRGPRSLLPRPAYISDSLDYVTHPSTGEVFTSKAAFREQTRALGLTEVGNEDFPERIEAPMDGPTVEEDIARAHEKLSAGASVDEPLWE